MNMLEETSVEQYIAQPSIQSFLVDAAGVIYDMSGPVPGARNAIRAIQDAGKQLFIATNNSTKSLGEIQARFADLGFEISRDRILSSGLGLQYDSETIGLIRGKHCYSVGWDESDDYFKNTGALLTKSLSEAETIVLLSSFNRDNDRVFNPIIAHLKKNPHIPLICTNPDRFVATRDGLFEVVGHYCEKIEKACGIKAHWIGKPYPNYHRMIETLIRERFQIDLRGSTVFFDDNIANLRAMSRDLGIEGCLVKNTGLAKQHPLPEPSRDSGMVKHYISSFSASEA